MKKLLPSLGLIIFTLISFTNTEEAFSQANEDTIEVQTFTYGSSLRGWFEFPSDTNTYRKIWLYYKLKCDQGTTADNFPCGEWDYLTYTFLYEHTGALDSVLMSQPSFEVNGQSPDSFAYMDQASWKYESKRIIDATVTDTTSFSNHMLAQNQGSVMGPIDSRYRTSRQYYLWKASDLQAAGLTAGDITGLTLRSKNSDANNHQLMIGMANSNRDSIDFYQDQGLSTQTVFDGMINNIDTGWNQITLQKPFDWNGTDNILISFSTKTGNAGNSIEFTGYPTSYASQAATYESEYSLDFQGRDYVEVDKSMLADIDKQVTISLWQYGDPSVQPQNDWVFEGMNADGQRILSSHLPWGNGRVYWDAGNVGNGYDRLEKAANTSDFEGQWNHWVFTKDADAGVMRMYLNGDLWASASGRNRSMAGIEKFLIGANRNGDGNYDGMIDEFAIWNRVLSAGEVKSFAFRKLDSLPAHQNGLQAYFQLNEGELQIANDEYSSKKAILLGMPGWREQKIDEPMLGFSHGHRLPDVQFQQGEFIYDFDTTYAIDSTMKDPISIVLWSDSAQAPMATDTLIKWPTYARMIFDNDGNIIDSVQIAPDHVLQKEEWPYYGEPFEVINRFELLRYITPYGIGLDLGAQGDGEGFTWKIDVTDFAPMLADSVELSAGNNQEFLDMKFVMIKGTPPRDVQRIENVYSGSHRYNADIETNFLTPKSYQTTANEKMARFRITNTGHGFGGNENCSEFCPKTHRVLVNGSKRFDQFLWRENCAMNPVYPQGGTWIYNRTNWCPGAEVDVDKYEITPFYNPGDAVTLDYDMQPGYNWNGNGSAPVWRIEAHLVTYDDPNFTNDAEVEMILSPNKWEYYKRLNPHCSNAQIRIRNSGSETLTSAKISYGVKGGQMQTFDWTGNLEFLQTEEVLLPLTNYGTWGGPNIFSVEISEPNGQTDENPANNVMETEFEKVPEYPEEVTVWLRTNAAGSETFYELYDENFNVVYSKDNLSPNTLYKDTIELEPGCYRFSLSDRDEDGLSFFANNDGTGFARLMDGFSTLHQFQPNFGAQISQSFTVGFAMSTAEPQILETFEIAPNPSNGQFRVTITSPAMKEGVLTVQNSLGQVVWQEELDVSNGLEKGIDLSDLPKGIYLVNLEGAGKKQTKKVLIQ